MRRADHELITQATRALGRRPWGMTLVDLGHLYAIAERCMAEVADSERGAEPLDAYSWRLGVVAALLHTVGARQIDPAEEIAEYLHMGAAR